MFCTRSAVVLSLVSFLLIGCVTTETSIFTEKKDKQKALDATTTLAREYISEGNWEAAKRHLRNALAIDENNADVHEAMALVFQNTGELELAESHYEKAIRLDSTFSRARLNYSAFLYSEKRYDAAASQLEKVVDDTLYEKRGLAFESLGMCYINMGKYDKAEYAFRRAHLLNRSNVVLIYRLADANFRLGDYEKSKKYYDSFRGKVKVQPAASLWLGVRLADKLGDKNSVSSYGLALKNLYPDSNEYLEYKQEFIDEPG